MQKWEYCIITGVHINSIGVFEAKYPRLMFFSQHGIETEVDLGNKGASQREKGFEKVDEGGYVAHTIAKLGLEGWEMVSTGPVIISDLSNHHFIYFRRPLENP